jgi:hypothetical protein
MWDVEFGQEFDDEFDPLPAPVQDGILAGAQVLERRGPTASRPRVDTLKGSKHTNMKELRVEAAGGTWRIAFAFDPDRKAILLVASDKAGVDQKRFYKTLIATADARYDRHLQRSAGNG